MTILARSGTARRFRIQHGARQVRKLHPEIAQQEVAAATPVEIREYLSAFPAEDYQAPLCSGLQTFTTMEIACATVTGVAAYSGRVWHAWRCDYCPKAHIERL